MISSVPDRTSRPRAMIVCWIECVRFTAAPSLESQLRRKLVGGHYEMVSVAGCIGRALARGIERSSVALSLSPTVRGQSGVASVRKSNPSPIRVITPRLFSHR
jgi:hypothetical protein